MMGGFIMDIKVNISWDEEASVYVAVCDKIGLALESDSYDSLIQRVKEAAPEMMELNNIQGCTTLSFLTDERRVECA